MVLVRTEKPTQYNTGAYKMFNQQLIRDYYDSYEFEELLRDLDNLLDFFEYLPETFKPIAY